MVDASPASTASTSAAPGTPSSPTGGAAQDRSLAAPGDAPPAGAPDAAEATGANGSLTSREDRIREAAYRRYEVRGADAPSDPLQDWLDAEQEIDAGGDLPPPAQ
jgi:hypothetical protein